MSRPDPNGCARCGSVECNNPTAARPTEATAESWIAAVRDCTSRPAVDWQAEARELAAEVADLRKPKSAADRLFDAWAEASRVEVDLYETLCARLGDDAFDDLAHDYYDRSIELLGCKPGLTLDADTLAFIAGLGFHRGWLNHTDGTVTEFERTTIGTPREGGHPRVSSGEAQRVRLALADLRAGKLPGEVARYTGIVTASIDDLVNSVEIEVDCRRHNGMKKGDDVLVVVVKPGGEV